MINVTLQRNDNNQISDVVSYTQDTININGETFAFPEGADLLFHSPHEQIIDPKRGTDGTLHATVIKQYTGKDSKAFETCDEHGHYCQCQVDEIPQEMSRMTPIMAEIKIEEVHEKTLSELIVEKESDVKDLKDQYLDADLDDDDELKLSLKVQIQELKKEIALLNENINKG